MCWFCAAEETQIVLSRPECENCPPANWNIYGSSVSPISFIHYVGSWRLTDLFRVSYDLYSIKSCLMNECATMSFLSGWMAVAFSSQSSHCNATRQASRCINALLLNESKYTTIYSCSWALSFPFSCSHQLPSTKKQSKEPNFRPAKIGIRFPMNDLKLVRSIVSYIRHPFNGESFTVFKGFVSIGRQY